MPLSWNISNTAAYKQDPESCFVEVTEFGETQKRLRWDIEGFIFWGGLVGFTEITEKNVAEYYGRSKLVEKIHQVGIGRRFVDGQAENVYVTPELLAPMVGLSTNHGTYSLAEWLKRTARNADVKMTKAEMHEVVIAEKYNYKKLMEKVPA